MKASRITGLWLPVTRLVYGDRVVGVDAAQRPETKSDMFNSRNDFTALKGTNPRYINLGPINGKNLTILPLGDSITNGFQSSDGNGYRLDLFQDLADNPAHMIGSVHAGTMPDNNNEGHDGAIISQIASSATASLALLPTVVLLMAGTNDMDKNISTSSAPDRLGALIDQIFAACPNTTLLVAQVTPSGKNTTEALILTYNAAIPNVVAQRAKVGSHVAVVDLYDALSFPADFADYLHPNDNGYKKIAATWYEGLQQANQKGWLDDKAPVVVTTSSAMPTPTPTGRLVNGGNGTGPVATGTLFVDSTTVTMATTIAAAVSTNTVSSTTATSMPLSFTTTSSVVASTTPAASQASRERLCGFWSLVMIGEYTSLGLIGVEWC
ncbi:hypothetical protein MMC34_001682 [Xylographa carneopallida]|nr:hypothetical protein [Xylographa carneopallida]